MDGHEFNRRYVGRHAERIAFPLGGIGAGMVCLSGTGALTSVSVRNRPELLHEPFVFGAISVRTGMGTMARVLEGPVPAWKITFPWPDSTGTGRGQQGKTFGLPRFARSHFTARFPFAEVALSDDALPVRVEVTGWSPFTPGNEDDSSLPLAAIEYLVTNVSPAPIDATISLHARNFLLPPFGLAPADGTGGVEANDRGFCLWRSGGEADPSTAARFAVACDDLGARASARWFRGDWWDPVTDLWRTIAAGELPEPGGYTTGAASAGGSLYVPVTLAAGETRRVAFRLSWYAPVTDLRRGAGPFDPAGRGDGVETHRPWYAAHYDSHEALDVYWRTNVVRLRCEAETFAACLHDMALPPEVSEAVAANLTILKSPTVLRQADGRLHLWEGCADGEGSFEGSCTHVFNYAQSIAHLFPRLERSLRETEFFDNQAEDGHQNFRAQLPIRSNPRRMMAAADGQLGGILKVHRDWRIAGDDIWLRRLWPRLRASLDYCIRTWDPSEEGWLTEPHHNTYDIEFWGPDGMAGSVYLAALTAAAAMGDALDEPVARYAALADRAKEAMQRRLFNGRWFIQQVRWDERAHKPDHSPETTAVIAASGPKYQYGGGCLSDGIVGEWLARVCGLEAVLDPAKTLSHLRAVHRHNFHVSLADHANPQRPAYALGNEGALLLCTWPDGDAPRFPFVYSDEAWTGIEYQVASHLIMCGEVEAGLRIVRAARRRYDGRARNPFSEFEWGHWYGRAMASWALLQAFTGQDYDARTRRLRIAPAVAGDVCGLLATERGYGLTGVRDGAPFLDVRHGEILVEAFDYTPWAPL